MDAILMTQVQIVQINDFTTITSLLPRQDNNKVSDTNTIITLTACPCYFKLAVLNVSNILIMQIMESYYPHHSLIWRISGF